MTEKEKNLISQNIFIISGPSGAGEDSIISGLTKDLEIERVITTTTRPMRADDIQGNPYYFISLEEFKDKITKGEFIEYAQEYNDNYYGVSSTELLRVAENGKVGLWKIEYKGVITAKKLFPDMISIFINAPLDVLVQRIKKRDGVGDEYIAERMKYTKEWLKYRDIYDFEVVNEQNKLDEAIAKTKQIILDKQSF